MAVLNLVNITKLYGAEIILSDISLQLQTGEKAGLIGPNGSGKTTLLKIVAGELEADAGQVHFSRGARVGYLAQEPPVLTGGNLRRHLEYPLRHLFNMQEEMSSLETEIARRSTLEGRAPENMLERYAGLAMRFELEGGYQVESRLYGVARGIGFTDSDLERDLSTFSGGEKTRARLAGLLLQDLDLLLLDEPTNFLDISALEWLEKYLRDLDCAVLAVSHDRFFLDRIAGQIFDLRRSQAGGHRLKTYRGNYSSYRQQLERERLSSDREYEHLRRIKDREERLVREAKADERSKRQAESRRKRLEKMENVERVQDGRRFKPHLAYSGRSGNRVVVFEQVSMKFGSSLVIEDLDFEISWGDRVALVGPNGAGKSTLLKLISGELEPTSGRVRLGPSVRVTYFSQEQEQLNPRHSLVDEITSTSDLDIPAARNHLGRYLFRGDDVFKKVGDLSGGEKNRLALARLALEGGNCLLMDEPTSHLDLPAMEELEKALAAYPGTLVIVSHDRFFLKGLAGRVFELSARSLQVYNDSFERYLVEKDKPVDLSPKAESNRRLPGKGQAVEGAVAAGMTSKQQEKLKKQEDYRRRREEQKRVRRLQNEQVGLEERIGQAEEAIAALEETLADPARYGDHVELAKLGTRLEAEKSKLQELYASWEDVSDRLDGAGSD